MQPYIHHISSETPFMIRRVCDASITRFYPLPTLTVSIPTSNPMKSKWQTFTKTHWLDLQNGTIWKQLKHMRQCMGGFTYFQVLMTMQMAIPIPSSASRLWSVLVLPLRAFSTSSNSTSTFVSIRHTSSALALPRNRAAPSINSCPPRTKKQHLSKKGHVIQHIHQVKFTHTHIQV